MSKLPRAPGSAPVVIDPRVWNELVLEVERLGRLSVAPPLQVSDGPAGRALSLRQVPQTLQWGVIVCPSGGETAFTDNRYNVALGQITNSDGDDTSALTVAAYALSDPRYRIVTATDLFENNIKEHALAPGTIVRLWADYDQSNPPVQRWTFIAADLAPTGQNCGSSGSSSSGSVSGPGPCGFGTTSMTLVTLNGGECGQVTLCIPNTWIASTA